MPIVQVPNAVGKHALDNGTLQYVLPILNFVAFFGLLFPYSISKLKQLRSPLLRG